MFSKLVHGCISQDSDCFAYGAKIVYRNFSISTQGAYAASGGAVDIYDINKAYENLSMFVFLILKWVSIKNGIKKKNQPSIFQILEGIK